MTLRRVRSLAAFVVLVFCAVGRAQPHSPGEPAIVEAWMLLGDDARALREAQLLVASDGAGWREHVAYIDAAAGSHLRWAVLDEYRWLAAQQPSDPSLALLAAWAEVSLSSGPALDGALLDLERCATGQGVAGQQLLARGLMRAGELERAAQVLVGARAPAAQQLRVEALVGLGSYRAAAQVALEALEAHPRHPEVAAPLWARGVPDGPVRRARKRAVERAVALLDDPDPVILLGAWQVLARDRDEVLAARAAQGVAAAVPGLALPPRLPYGRSMIEHLGEGLARTGQETVPAELTTDERAQVAAVRARTLRDDGLVDQARRAYREAIALAGDDPELLLEAAALHLDVEPQRSLEWVGQALVALACAPDRELGARRATIARGLELQAASLRALEHHDQALGFQLVASLLQPTPQGLVQLAALQERQGEPEAALESLSLAAAMGSQEALREMERLYRGPASVEALVEAAEEDLAQWVSAIAEPAPATDVFGGRVLSTTAGDLSLADLQGEVVVLVFWASWCAPCAQELPLVAELAAGWRSEALPVRVVAISVDESEADYRRGTKRFQALDLPFSLAPDLAGSLDVRAVPATILLDGRGALAGRLQGFQEGHAERLDTLVRTLLEQQTH